MGIFVPRIPFQHKVYRPDGQRDSHGNRTGGFDPPVERLAISAYPLMSSTRRDDYVAPDVVARTETDIIIDVEDSSIFKPQDVVILAGVSFKVQGTPQYSSWDHMPIDGYADIVPSQVHCKRVT
jgi:hypothetical protein